MHSVGVPLPKMTVITRKAYGGASDVMNTKDVYTPILTSPGPTAEIAVMGVQGAVEIIFRHEIDHADDKAKRQKELQDEYGTAFADRYQATDRGYIDEVVYPHETRNKLIKAFALIHNKVDYVPQKKHDNLPI